MPLYICQSLCDFKFKGGWAEVDRLEKRIRDHETAGGPQLWIARHDTSDRTDEGRLFADMADWRVAASGSRRRDYELFACTPKALRYLESRAFTALGFSLLRRPLNPEKESCLEWQQRIAMLSRGVAGAAARENIKTDLRVAELRREHGGGWTFADAVAGVPDWGRKTGTAAKQTSFDFAVSVFEERGLHYCLVRCKGRSFRYAVFAEAQRRKGIPVHPKAVDSGFPWGKPVLPSPRVAKALERHSADRARLEARLAELRAEAKRGAQ